VTKQIPLTIATTTQRGARAIVDCTFCPFVSITPNEELAVQITAEVHYVTAHGANRTELEWTRPWRIAQA
jgi:hypothetical protein